MDSKIQNLPMDAYFRNLIAVVRGHPLLWDPSREGYTNREARKGHWKEIDDELEPPQGLNAKDSWEQLTRRFANALKRRKRRHKKGYIDSKEWKFENEMSFLLPVKQKRMSISCDLGPYTYMSLHHISDSNNYGSVTSTPDNSNSNHSSPVSDNDTVEGGGHCIIPDNQHTQMDNEAPLVQLKSEIPDLDPRLITRQRKRKHLDEQQQYRVTINDPTQREIENIDVSVSSRFNFFLSVMPMIDALSDDKFLELQMDVIQAIRKQRRNASTQETCASTSSIN